MFVSSVKDDVTVAKVVDLHGNENDEDIALDVVQQFKLIRPGDRVYVGNGPDGSYFNPASNKTEYRYSGLSVDSVSEE